MYTYIQVPQPFISRRHLASLALAITQQVYDRMREFSVCPAINPRPLSLAYFQFLYWQYGKQVTSSTISPTLANSDTSPISSDVRNVRILSCFGTTCTVICR